MGSILRHEECRPPAPDRLVRRNSLTDIASRVSADPIALAALRAQLDVTCDRSLSRLIECEIIPRLMLAHGSMPPAAASPDADDDADRTRIGAHEVEAFAPLVFQVEADALLAHVEAILARGVGIETVLVDLFAPTARILGRMWEEDTCDFVDVTMGLWRMQEVVNEICAGAPPARRQGSGRRRALFAAVPGDQHTFGTTVIENIFRREGWLTSRLADGSADELQHRVEADWFDLIALTVTCDCNIRTLPGTIAALRTASQNARVCVMVGGRVFSTDPDLALRVGADGTAQDARMAPMVAAELVRECVWGAAVGS